MSCIITILIIYSNSRYDKNSMLVFDFFEKKVIIYRYLPEFNFKALLSHQAATDDSHFVHRGSSGLPAISDFNFRSFSLVSFLLSVRATYNF